MVPPYTGLTLLGQRSFAVIATIVTRSERNVKRLAGERYAPVRSSAKIGSASEPESARRSLHLFTRPDSQGRAWKPLLHLAPSSFDIVIASHEPLPSRHRSH